MPPSSRQSVLRTWIARCAALAALLAPAVHAEVILVTSADSNVDTLSRDEAEQLYLGRRSSLADGRPLLLLDLPPGPVRDQFYRLLTGKNPSQIRAYWSRMVFTGRALPPRESVSVEDARRLLLENPGTVGYLPDTFASDPSLHILLHLE